MREGCLLAVLIVMTGVVLVSSLLVLAFFMLHL